MEQNKKIRLMEVACQEFSDKGYQGTSLRSICEKAEVTTGTLYFFFSGKEDLFIQIIGDVVNEFKVLSQDSSKSGKRRVHYFLCEHRQEMNMLFSGAKGTRLEGILDEYKDIIKQAYQYKNTDQEWLKLVVEMHYKAYKEILKLEINQEKRMKLMEKVDLLFLT